MSIPRRGRSWTVPFPGASGHYICHHYETVHYMNSISNKQSDLTFPSTIMGLLSDVRLSLYIMRDWGHNIWEIWDLLICQIIITLLRKQWRQKPITRLDTTLVKPLFPNMTQNPNWCKCTLNHVWIHRSNKYSIEYIDIINRPNNISSPDKNKLEVIRHLKINFNFFINNI